MAGCIQDFSQGITQTGQCRYFQGHIWWTYPGYSSHFAQPHPPVIVAIILPLTHWPLPDLNVILRCNFNLGVILDNKLNWHAHCEYICGKMSKGIGIIIKTRKVFNETTLLSRYNSLILPYVSYCIHVWGKAYDTHLKHVLVLQNKAVRIIAGVPPRTSADNLYLELDILPVKKIFVHAISIFMYKYVNGMLPELFLDMFTPVSEIHNYDTRQAINKNLFVSFKSTSRGQQSITYIGPHVWNFILSKINPHCSIGSFKRHIRQLLQHCSVSDLTWWSLTL